MERFICINNGLKLFVVVIKILWVNYYSLVVIFVWLVMEILVVGILLWLFILCYFYEIMLYEIL